MNREEALQIFERSDEIVSAVEVTAAVERMAREIELAIGEEFPLVLSVMGGAAVFTGMILPHLNFPLEFDYVHLTRYRNTTQGGDMQWRVAPAESVKDRVVLVLDDILDEGQTLAAIGARILEMGAKRFTSAVLCEKMLAISKPIKPDFCGVQVPDRYVFGCGMDVKGYWRNLPAIRAFNEA
ncbi:MAG: hypoxanthine-guanine phosphoribosyltransferase [Janthinobacterium lividum]